MSCHEKLFNDQTQRDGNPSGSIVTSVLAKEVKNLIGSYTLIPLIGENGAHGI